MKKSVVASAVLVLAILGAGGACSSDESDAEKASASAAERRHDAAAKRASGDISAEELEKRGDLVGDLENQVTKSAREGVKDDDIDGPIAYTKCTARPGDSDEQTGTFTCLAVRSKDQDGKESGYDYRGTIDWKTEKISWQVGS